MFRVSPALVAALSLAALPLGGCGQQAKLSVADAWVRLAAVPGRPAAGYFTVRGGATDAALIGVSTKDAARTEMHESMAAMNGGMTMDAIRQVPVRAQQEVRFAPGSKHAMLFDVNPAIKPGGTMTLVFTFADATRIEQPARVLAAGDPPPSK